MEVSKLNALVKTVQNTETKKAENEPPKATSDNKNAKILGYSMLGLAVLGAAGIAVHQRSKAKKVLTNAVEAFKENGNKFEKGKAVLADGKGYTGFLTKVNKNGDKIAMEYKDGVLIKSVKNEGNNVLSGNFVKNYKYDANGKLEFVEKERVVMDATLKTTTDIAQKKAEGLAKFEQKQAEAAKKLELEKKMEPTIKELKRTGRDIDANYIDKSFNDYDGPAEAFKDYRGLRNAYSRLEQKELANKENIAQLKTQLRKPTEINAQKIDEQLAGGNSELTKLNEYYKGLEQKELANKENVTQLKTQLHKPTEISAQKIDEQLEKGLNESNKLKESLLNPKVVEDSQVMNIAKDYNENYIEMMRYGKEESDAAFWLARATAYVNECPPGYFKRVDKVVKIGDKTCHIIFEGLGVDITAEGKLLKKVLVTVGDLTKVEHENMTEAAIKSWSKASERIAAQATQTQIVQEKPVQLAYA